jgi:MFS family permease
MAPSALRTRLGLNAQTGAILGALFLVSLGEELWSPYLPHYLDSLGASLFVIGLWSAGKNLLEGFLFWGGGALSHRLGERGTLALVGLVPLAGYIVFLATDSVGAAIVASFLIASWESLTVPATFAVVGRSLAEGSRTSAFALQSMQKRLPRIVGPWIGGIVLAVAGVAAGVRSLLFFAMLCVIVSIAVQWFLVEGKPPAAPRAISKREVWRAMPPFLKRLWWSDVLVRWGDWLARDFIVLYCLKTIGISTALFGTLVALQMTTALATYLPVATLVDRGHQRPFVGLTFVLFALTPACFALAHGTAGLVLAFVCYGLREIGEPARKGLITSLFPEEYRARGVGLYWGWRAFAIFPAPVVGALLWQAYGPRALLWAACATGIAGAALFVLTTRSNGGSGLERTQGFTGRPGSG